MIRKVSDDQRNGKIDNLRAIAILLVVIGHSIILYSSAWNLYTTDIQVPVLDKVKAWINLIQMPLFFMLSGFLFHPKPKVGKLILDKAKRLLVPYFCIAAFWMIPIKIVLQYPLYENRNYFQIIWKDIFLYTDTGHLWFLPCLFMCFISAYGLFHLVSRIPFQQFVKVLHIAVLAALLWISIKSNQISPLLLKNLAKYLVWFYLGICMNLFIETLSRWSKNYLLCILIFICTFLFSLKTLGKYNEIVTAALLLTGYLAIPNKTNRITDYLSKNSFGIYLFHSPLIYITFTYWKDESPIVVIALNFLLFGGIACVLSSLIAKSPIKFMVGIFSKKETSNA